MSRYEVITYDLWGNDKDGYAVNDAFISGVISINAENMDDKQIIQALKKDGWIKRGFRFNSFTIDGECDYSLYINYSTQKCFIPLLELRSM